MIFEKKIVKFRYVQTKGKLKIFKHKNSHSFVDLDELLLKMYTVLRFHIVLIKKTRKNVESK